MNVPRLSLRDYLAKLPNRCALGFHVSQHPTFCSCDELGDWSIFLGALRQAVGADGLVHQKDVRPLIKGRIAPKSIGPQYTRAKAMGVLVFVGKEPSTDAAGRNTHHDSPYYELHLEALRSEAAA